MLNSIALGFVGMAAMCLAHLAASTAPKSVSVCEAISNLERYRGKMLVVEGVLRGGARHGWYLQDRLEEKKCPAVAAGEQTWPAQIALEEYTHSADLEDGPADFETDPQVDNMLARPKRLVMQQGDVVVVITLAGQLRSRKGITILQSGEGWYVGDGYGQSGQYPALLIIKSVQGVRISKVAVP